MTREAFIRKWLGKPAFYLHTEENKTLMRADLDDVIARHGTATSDGVSLAVAQFTGWKEAISNGRRIVDLVESMGLTESEWLVVRPQVSWLDVRDLTEIDSFFKKQQ